MRLLGLHDLQLLPFQNGGKVVHFSQDSYGRVLVIDAGDQRILNFDSLFEQSCMQLSNPYQLVHQYTQVIVLALAFIKPAQVAVLGLGGGSLLRTFHYLLPNCRFRVIELRQIVVDIAKEYFFIPEDDRVNISVDDAFNAIAQLESGSHDIILSDMYDAYCMAPNQIQREFLTECSRVMSDQGWLLLNLHDLPSGRAEFFDMLCNIFPTVILSAASENTVIFLSNGQHEYLRINYSAIESIEGLLQQKFKKFLSRLQPINFHFA